MVENGVTLGGGAERGTSVPESTLCSTKMQRSIFIRPGVQIRYRPMTSGPTDWAESRSEPRQGQGLLGG